MFMVKKTNSKSGIGRKCFNLIMDEDNMKPSFHLIVTHKCSTTKIWSQGCLFSLPLLNSALQGQPGDMGKTLENTDRSYEERRRRVKGSLALHSHLTIVSGFRKMAA